MQLFDNITNEMVECIFFRDIVFLIILLNAFKILWYNLKASILTNNIFNYNK